MSTDDAKPVRPPSTPGRPGSTSTSPNLNQNSVSQEGRFIEPYARRQRSLRCSSLHQSFSAEVDTSPITPSNSSIPDSSSLYRPNAGGNGSEGERDLGSESSEDMGDHFESPAVDEGLDGAKQAQLQLRTRRNSFRLPSPFSPPQGPRRRSSLSKYESAVSNRTSDKLSDSSNSAQRRGYIRGASSMLPKPKTFQRVVGQLRDEATPLESEMRREAFLSAMFRDGTDPADETGDEDNLSVFGLEDEAQSHRSEKETISWDAESETSDHVSNWFRSRVPEEVIRMFLAAITEWQDQNNVFSPSSVSGSRAIKRKNGMDERFDPYKRRAVSPPAGSPILSPVSHSHSSGSKRNMFHVHGMLGVSDGN